MKYIVAIKMGIVFEFEKIQALPITPGIKAEGFALYEQREEHF